MCCALIDEQLLMADKGLTVVTLIRCRLKQTNKKKIGHALLQKTTEKQHFDRILQLQIKSYWFYSLVDIGAVVLQVSERPQAAVYLWVAGSLLGVTV